MVAHEGVDRNVCEDVEIEAEIEGESTLTNTSKKLLKATSTFNVSAIYQ